MGIQKRLARVGLAKQTAKGAAAASPTYGFGLLDGQVLTVEIDQENEEVTSDKRTSPGANRLKVIPGSEFSTRAYPKVLGLLLYGSLGSISTSGTNPYTHVISPGDDLPYLTLFGRQGAEYPKVPDNKISKLTIGWEEAGPLEVGVETIGTDLTLGGAPWTATNDEKDSGGKFRAAGGTFKLDASSAVPVTAKVKSGDLEIANDIEAIILSDSVKPNDVFPSIIEIMMGLTIVPDDFTEWKKIVTGTGTGTAITDVPIYGSYEVKFILDANTDLILAATRVGFTADFPEADPAGGPVEQELTGGAFDPAAGATFTATLKNSVVSY